MSINPNTASLDPVQQRYKFFADQNVEEGHFDVTFEFGTQEDSDNNPGNNTNAPFQQLFAHSFTLWPSSKIFEKTLFGPLAHKGPIPVLRHSFEDFKEFLTFMYLGKCNIKMENVMALVDLGEYYEVKLLKDQCEEFLTNNSTEIENVLKVYESLKVYSLENAMQIVMEFVAGNTLQILKTEEFLGAQKETILDIVKMKNLTAKQEDLFEGICKWAEHNCPKDTVNRNEFLKDKLADMMPLIDFSIMEFNFLNSFVVRKGFLFPSFDALSDALCEAAGKKQRAKEERLKIVPKRRRIQITNQNGQKAFADICDPTIIAAIEAMTVHNQVKSVAREYCQFNAYLGPPTAPSPKFCLVRDSSGYLTLKTYTPSNPNNTCCLVRNRSGGYYSNSDFPCNECASNINKGLQNVEIIAPVFSTNNCFTLGNRCTIEFV
uniref:BTB domain-containing protein n=1 Tax=Panagrolaimus sp. ES5 TaxID=591445 RepID=A0AC34FYN8_9BILA